MTDTTQVRPRFGRFDDHDENSEDGRPTYGDEGIVFDADDAFDEDRAGGLPFGRRVDAALTGVALAVVALFSGSPGRWGTIRYVTSARLRLG